MAEIISITYFNCKTSDSTPVPETKEITPVRSVCNPQCKDIDVSLDLSRFSTVNCLDCKFETAQDCWNTSWTDRRNISFTLPSLLGICLSCEDPPDPSNAVWICDGKQLDNNRWPLDTNCSAKCPNKETNKNIICKYDEELNQNTWMYLWGVRVNFDTLKELDCPGLLKNRKRE